MHLAIVILVIIKLQLIKWGWGVMEIGICHGSVVWQAGGGPKCRTLEMAYVT